MKPPLSTNPTTAPRRHRASLRDGVRISRETAWAASTPPRPSLPGERTMDEAVRILHTDRLHQRKSLQAVAMAAGISHQALSLIEAGERTPLGETFVNLCHALGQSPGALMLPAEGRVKER